MRGRSALCVAGIVFVILGSGFLVTARDNAALADDLVRRGGEAVVAAQVHVVGGSSKNGDQYLSVDAVRVVEPGSGAFAPAADSGADDPADQADGAWTPGWVPLTGVGRVDDLPYDAALDGRWVPGRPGYGYSSPLAVRYLRGSDRSLELMADQDVVRWSGPEETTDAAAMLVAGVLCLLAVVLIVRADTRRALRRRAVQEARRLALYGPQDAVPPTPQDAPLSRRERGRRRDHVGRHRAPPEEVARGDGAGTAG